MKIVAAVLAAAVVASLASAAQAADILQYASTSVSPDAASAVSYTNGVITLTNEPVYVTLFAPNSYGPSPVAAHLSFTGVADAPAGDLFTFFYAQDLGSLTFSLTADTPVGGLTNILSGGSTTALLSGTDAGMSVSAQNPGDGVTFTSDFIDLSDLGDFSLQLNTAPTTPMDDSNGNNFADFSGPATPGSFSADTVPEPATLGLLAMGGVMLMGRRRRV